MSYKKKVVAWWSGGVTSAVACKLSIDMFGIDNVRIVFIDTHNEDDDTYRFKEDCERWYKKEIETITRIGDGYDSIQDTWRRYNSLNVGTGAICSYELKRVARERWQKNIDYDYQVFGFDISEGKRGLALSKNHKAAKPVYPLLFHGLTKKDCIDIITKEGIDVPVMYQYGFLNNNCFKTGCVQGGIGYWQKMARDFPEKFDTMARMEHELTDRKGSPVTMLKDQSKKAKDEGNQLVFLKPHPSYPHIKDISMMAGREPKPLFECNGFCGTNDFDRNPTEEEVNFQTSLFNE